MEQGVFLDRLKLMDEDENIITGPFRESELWSPDKKRLTLWFHPGRQKTGINLQQEEGSILRPSQLYTLLISGTWRSESGVSLGEDYKYKFKAGKADHLSPQMTKWELQSPKAGTRDFLRIHFDEPLDFAMLTGALKVRQILSGKCLTLKTTINQVGQEWKAQPNESWSPGAYELIVDPLLEDLAGNSLTKLFETDIVDKNSSLTPQINSLKFLIQ
jgi:hypothetical protein